MANENANQIQISPADLERALEAIAVLEAVLKPYLIALKPEERAKFPKMGDKSLPFVEKITEYCVSNPEFVPTYMNVDSLNSNFQTANELNQLLRPVVQLANGLNDTTLLAGSEAYTNALTYYSSIKEASKKNVPHAKTIFDDLKKRFERIKTKKDKNQEE